MRVSCWIISDTASFLGTTWCSGKASCPLHRASPDAAQRNLASMMAANRRVTAVLDAHSASEIVLLTQGGLLPLIRERFLSTA